MQLATLTPGHSISMVNSADMLWFTHVSDPYYVLGVSISVFSDSGGFIVGSEATLTCSSDNGVADRIEWRSREGQVLVSRDSVQQIDLILNPVNDSLHDSSISCSVIRDEGRANQTVSSQTLPISVRGGCVQYNTSMQTCQLPNGD